MSGLHVTSKENRVMIWAYIFEKFPKVTMLTLTCDVGKFVVKWGKGETTILSRLITSWGFIKNF